MTANKNRRPLSMKQLLIFSLLLQAFSVYANEKFTLKVYIPKGSGNFH